jgi:hypothetical protein
MVLPLARQERLPAVEDRPPTKPLFLEDVSNAVNIH